MSAEEGAEEVVLVNIDDGSRVPVPYLFYDAPGLDEAVLQWRAYYRECRETPLWFVEWMAMRGFEFVSFRELDA